jgi:hypothetical protein
LEKKGLYKGVVDNAMRLGICSRSGDVIEPMIKPQWYVNCKEMANEACNAVRDGRLQIIPSQFEDTWFRFLLVFFHLPSIHILPPQKHSHVTLDIRFVSSVIFQ